AGSLRDSQDHEASFSFSSDGADTSAARCDHRPPGGRGYSPCRRKGKRGNGLYGSPDWDELVAFTRRWRAPQTRRTVEPVVSRASSARCASAAEASGKRFSIRTRTFPDRSASKRSSAVATRSPRLSVYAVSQGRVRKSEPLCPRSAGAI